MTRLGAVAHPSGIQFTYDGFPVRVYASPATIRKASAAFGADMLPQAAESVVRSLAAAGIRVSLTEVTHVLKGHIQ